RELVELGELRGGLAVSRRLARQTRRAAHDAAESVARAAHLRIDCARAGRPVRGASRSDGIGAARAVTRELVFHLALLRLQRVHVAAELALLVTGVRDRGLEHWDLRLDVHLLRDRGFREIV